MYMELASAVQCYNARRPPKGGHPFGIIQVLKELTAKWHRTWYRSCRLLGRTKMRSDSAPIPRIKREPHRR
ncbi:hypothetical protein A0H81_01881 [Grifola frondosa]|uniref:Uncharacterized protein n=1 Tax=Grifola frondosa TaxID=5627 RepID=A0A1C7MML7_GRIFR|nr:hypothetical protein A0H81_01881 [Grifola frondosa]